jgi:BlaI family penicillinase repressor
MAMKDAPRITDAEYYIMKTLWANDAPMNASMIIDSLRDETGWSPKTIHTLISRLAAKKAIRIVGENPYKYTASISEDEFRRHETKSFLTKLYNGSVHHLVANFIKEEALTQEEIEDLKRLLER